MVRRLGRLGLQGVSCQVFYKVLQGRVGRSESGYGLEGEILAFGDIWMTA